MNLKSFITTLIASVLLLVSVAQNVYAKDENVEKYLEKTFNPHVNKVVKKYNNTLKENWYYNLSNYLLKKEKDSTIEKLETLREDIKALKKEVKKIKGPKSAGKKDKKSIKATKKHLTKALNKTDTDAKKLIKNIKKDKKIKTISDRNTEKSRVAKASNEYLELNKKYDIETKELKLNEFIEINENLAKSFINKQEKEKKKLKEKKKVQKKEAKHKKAEKKYLNSLSDDIAGKSEKILYEVMKSEYTPPKETLTSVTYDESSKILKVTFPGSDNFSNEWIKGGFYDDAAKAFKTISKNKELDEINEIEINITFPMQDKYGNVEDDIVMETVMSRETLNKINWNQFNPENLQDVADSLRLHPAFHLYN